MIPFIGFAPDSPLETPGIFTDCSNILPGISDFRSAPSPVDSGLGALDSACLGFATVRKTDNSRRVFAGDSGKLYEVSSGAWADVSKSGGYSLGADDRWRFAQFGNKTIATAKSATIQGSTSGAFADLSASAPKAAIVETINNQVFAFNTTDASFGDDKTRWWCSAVGNETDWTPSIATQCVSGQLLGAPGEIVAGRRLGNIIVAYKNRAMFVGQYVGAPAIWDFQMVPGEIGTFCQESVVSIGTAHYFVGPDDFYVFDGTRPAPLNSPVREWFFANLDAKYAYRIVSAYDYTAQRIFWWFPISSSNGVPSKCVVLNIKTGRWGRMDGEIEAAAEYVAPGVTIDGLDALYPTIDDLPDISFDSPIWTAGSSQVAVFCTDHKACTYSGSPGASSITTGHHGDQGIYSTVSRVIPRFIKAPSSSTLLYSYADADAESFTQNITSAYLYGWYDVLWSAHWHRFEMRFSGEMKISGYDLKITADGEQ